MRKDVGKNTVPKENRSVVCMPFICPARSANVFKTIKMPARTDGGTGDLKINGLEMTNKPTPTWTNWRVFSPEILNVLRSTSLKATKPRIITKKIPKVIHSFVKGWYKDTVPPCLFGGNFREFTGYFQEV